MLYYVPLCQTEISQRMGPLQSRADLSSPTSRSKLRPLPRSSPASHRPPSSQAIAFHKDNLSAIYAWTNLTTESICNNTSKQNTNIAKRSTAGVQEIKVPSKNSPPKVKIEKYIQSSLRNSSLPLNGIFRTKNLDLD